MSKRLLASIAALVLAVLAGCSGKGPELTGVTGAVTQDGKPLAGAFLRFVPQGNTPGHGGIAKTDDQGRYEVLASRQDKRKGLMPGEYKVVMSRRLMPDGSPPPPNVPPIESPARETLPAIYTKPEQTPLSIVVGAEAMTFPIAISAEGN